MARERHDGNRVSLDVETKVAGESVSGRLEHVGNMLAFRPDADGQVLEFTTENISWVKFPMLGHVRLKPTDGRKKMVFESRKAGDPQFDLPQGALAQEQSEKLAEIRGRLKQDGVRVFQDRFSFIMDPVSREEIPRVLFFPSLLVHFLGLLVWGLCGLLLPIAFVGNLFGLGAESFPRNWVEVGIEVVLIPVAWAFYLFVREFRPGLAKWQLGWSALGAFCYFLFLLMTRQ